MTADDAPADEGEDDEPDIDEDDLADIPEDIAEQVASEAAEDAAEQDDGDSGDAAAGDGEPPEGGDPDLPSPGDGGDDPDVSVGHVYCRALGLAGATARDRYGDLDEAATFAESDVTVSTSEGVTVSSGSITFRGAEYFSYTSSNFDYDSDPGTRGIEVRPDNKGVDSFEVTLVGGADAPADAYVERVSDGTELARKNASAGDTVVFDSINWSAGTKYRILVDADNIPFDISEHPTDLSGVATITGGVGSRGITDSHYLFSEVRVKEEFTAGEASVSFGDPGNIDGYDILSADLSPGDISITIDVVDADGTVLKEDISGDVDATPISPDKKVSFEVSFSRPDTSNNGTLDYLARQYIE